MKRANWVVFLGVVGLVGAWATGAIIPGTPSTYPSVSIKNTPHNLNNYPGVHIPGNQICLPCHTPHNAGTVDGQNILLWNHKETEATFSMYAGVPGQPQGRSKLCLSCHDGVTALDSYGGATGSIVMTGDHALGTDLRNDHPIGIQYPTGSPNDFKDPSTFAAGISGPGSGVRLVSVSGVDRVECTSCHNVHNNGLGNFLRVPVQESYICLQCHIK